MDKKNYNILDDALMGSLLLSISIFACFYYVFNNINSDLYFLLANGRYICENQNLFPTFLPNSIHNNLPTVIQQPLFSLISWLCFEMLSFFGVHLLSGLCVLICSVVLFSLFKDAEHVFIRYLLTSLFLLAFCSSFSSRPSEVTVTLLLLEILLFNSSFLGSGLIRALVLFLLSLLQLLMHAAFYPFFLGIMAFFIVRVFYTSRKVELPCIIAFILSFVSSTFTPYGIKLPLYLFISYPAASYGGYIKELKALPFFSVYTVFVIALLIYVYKTYKSCNVMDLILAFLGIFLLGMHLRNFYIFGIFSVPYMLSSLNAYKSDNKRHNTGYLKTKVLPYFFALVFTIVFFFTATTANDIKDSSVTPIAAAAYLKDKGNTRIFTEFNNGAFFEFMGIRAYIDARPELYQKVLNETDDIYMEYLSLYSDDVFDYNDFISKYGFDYIVASNNTSFYYYLKFSDVAHPVVKGNGYELFEVLK